MRISGGRANIHLDALLQQQQNKMQRQHCITRGPSKKRKKSRDKCGTTSGNKNKQHPQFENVHYCSVSSELYSLLHFLSADGDGKVNKQTKTSAIFSVCWCCKKQTKRKKREKETYFSFSVLWKCRQRKKSAMTNGGKSASLFLLLWLNDWLRENWAQFCSSNIY